jgi:hypothetical protein
VDEAHRLRNVYKSGNKIAKSIFDSISDRPKLLLTATPLQNTLMELFGLVSFIDPHLFGNEDAFREQYARYGADLAPEVFGELRNRLAPVCQRTLRRQVVEYVRYTNRTSLAQDFTPTEDEVRLYESVSTYLQRPTSFALPKGQRQLLTLVLRKILASSSYAIAATLGTMLERLELKESGMPDEAAPDAPLRLIDHFDQDRKVFLSGDNNEEQLRAEFLNPFCESLGWDVSNKAGLAGSWSNAPLCQNSYSD